MEEKALTELGLSQNEAKIYLALVKLGSTTATAIIKVTGLHRANVYDTLEKLHEKGLISSITKVNIKHYQAAAPSKLLEIIKEKELRVIELLPKLEADFEASKSKEEVRVFKGKKGLKTAIDDVLKENKTWYVFGATGKLSEILQYYIPHWNKQREKQRIKIKIIYDESLRGKKEELKYMERKYLKSEFSFPIGIGIYGDKVILIVFGEEPLITITESRLASKGFMEYFNLLWDIAKS